jgi:S1-C subfamily serine protease
MLTHKVVPSGSGVLGACAALLALLIALAPARAGEEDAARPNLTRDLVKAVLRVDVQVPPGARTARYLGTERHGTGVLIDGDGLIVTIGYLITEAMAAQVTGPSGKPVIATIVGFDSDSGLGLLRANEPLGVKPIRLGHAAPLAAKETVLLASAGEVQPGQVTARRPFAGYWEYLLDDAIFTEPPLDDWSGAALIGADGTLLGIGSLLVPNTSGGGGLHPGNMFVPIDHLKPVLADLLTLGRPGDPPHPWLGVNVAPAGDGLVIMRVSQESPADKAGLSRGDRVLAVAGQPVKDLADFYRKVWAQGDAGVSVPLTVQQDGERHEVKVPTMDRYRYLKLDTTY